MTFTLQINTSVKSDDVITLRNRSCPVIRNKTHVVVSTSFTDCGTTFEETDEHFVFTNILTVSPVLRSSTVKSGVILRGENIPRDYELHCYFNKFLSTSVESGRIDIIGNNFFY